MPFFLHVVIVLISSFLLIRAVQMFIHSASRIAHTFNISGYTISFLLVAIATSLPETVVGITSAIEKKPMLSYGNALGSNIALLTVIVAIPGILNSGINTRQIFKNQDIYFTAFFSLLALALSIDGTLGFFDGLALLVGYIIYIFAVLRRSSPLERIFHTFEHTNIWRQFFIFLFSLALLLLASEGIVQGALNASNVFNLKVGFVGLTIAAIGTSLPEMAYAIALVKENKENEIMGDVIGSVVANSTLVLGITSIIHPIQISKSGIGVSGNVALIFALVIFFLFSKTREKIDRFEAVLLLVVYILFIGFEYFITVG